MPYMNIISVVVVFFRCVFSSFIYVYIGYISHAGFLLRFLILVNCEKIKF